MPFLPLFGCRVGVEATRQGVLKKYIEYQAMSMDPLDPITTSSLTELELNKLCDLFPHAWSFAVRGSNLWIGYRDEAEWLRMSKANAYPKVGGLIVCFEHLQVRRPIYKLHHSSAET